MLKYINYSLVILILFSCNNKAIEYRYPKAAGDLRQDRIGHFYKQSNLSINKEKNTNNSNNYLWQASLDIISFIPISSVDSNSGMIITDWYMNNKEPNEKFKLNINIKSNEISINAIDVKVFKQVLDQRSIWIDTDIDKNLSIEFADKIIDRAKQIRISRI